MEEDDEEAAFEEMIEEMVVPEETALEAREALPASILPRRMKGDAFTCSSCHLTMARPCLADEERRLCHECALEAASALPLAHRHPVERPARSVPHYTSLRRETGRPSRSRPRGTPVLAPGVFEVTDIGPPTPKVHRDATDPVLRNDAGLVLTLDHRGSELSFCRSGRAEPS